MKPDAYDRGNPAIRFVLARLSDAAWNGLHARSVAGRWYLRGVHWRTSATLVAAWAVGLVGLFLSATIGVEWLGRLMATLALLGLPAAMVLLCFVLVAAMASARQMPGIIHDMMSGAKGSEDVAVREVVGLVRSVSVRSEGHADLVRAEPWPVRRWRYVIVDRMSNAVVVAGILCVVAAVIVTVIAPAVAERLGALVIVSGGMQIGLVVRCVTRSRRDARVVERRVIEGKCCSCGYVIAEGVKSAGACSECGWIRGGEVDAAEGEGGGG